jgi:hypothetical protein
VIGGCDLARVHLQLSEALVGDELLEDTQVAAEARTNYWLIQRIVAVGGRLTPVSDEPVVLAWVISLPNANDSEVADSDGELGALPITPFPMKQPRDRLSTVCSPGSFDIVGFLLRW